MTMNALNETLPEIDPQESPLQTLHQKAHYAMRVELRDFDWMSLDMETTRRIHAMLPPDNPH